MNTKSPSGLLPNTQTSSTASLTRYSDRAYQIGGARANLLVWSSYIDRAYRCPRHVRLLADYLMRVEQGEIRRLMVMMPPRHSKMEFRFE